MSLPSFSRLAPKPGKRRDFPLSERTPATASSSQALLTRPFDPPLDGAGSDSVGTCEPLAWVTPSSRAGRMMGKRLCACALWSSERAVSGTGGSVTTSALPSERNQSHNLPLSLSHHSQHCQNPDMPQVGDLKRLG